MASRGALVGGHRAMAPFRGRGGGADIAKCSHWLCQPRSGEHENTSTCSYWDPWAMPQAS